MINRFEGSYAFLSNFSDSIIPIKLSDTIFYCSTVEHAYQAMKAKDSRERMIIASCRTPGLAKRLGRQTPLREDWEDIKIKVMEACLRKKFSRPEMERKLLETGSQELVEGNYWHDNFWGNCSCPRCALIEGQNHLGRLLMKIRDEKRKL